MLGELGVELVIIVALTLANGFFAGSEIAIVSSRRSRLETMANAGKRSAQQALQLADNPDRFLATVQVGITFIGTFSAAFGGARIGDVLAAWFKTSAVLEPYAETLSLLIVVALITYLSLILGELVPKRLALRNAEQLALFAAPVMMLLSTIARPLVGFLTLSVNLVFRLLGQQNIPEGSITAEDIVYMVREGTESGALEAGEAQFIHRVFQFTDRPVRTMMTPRTQITAVSADTPLPQVIEIFLISGYSRLPVYEGSADHITGILYIKDALRAFVEKHNETSVKELARPAIFIVETAHGDDVMAQFRQQGIHIALVIDEYGQVVGLITLEDLLEELVGEIRDEYEHSEEQPYVQRDDGSWLIDGMEPHDKVCKVVGLKNADEAELTTLAGTIMSKLGRVPTVGDAITIEGFIFEVVDMDGRRIDKVMVRLAEPPSNPDSEADLPSESL